MDTEPQRAQAYASSKRKLWLLDGVVTLGFLMGIIATGGSRLWAGWVEAHAAGDFFQVALYAGGLSVAATMITLPIDWFRGYLLEHRFNLSTQSFIGWAIDYAKQLALGSVLGLLVVESLWALIRWDPKTWWAWAALFWFGYSVLLTRIAPALLIPIFYKQRPLADAKLQERLSQLLSTCGEKMRSIFEIDLSRTTRKANACLTGLGKSRRVLLSDTLISNYPLAEIEAVLAHELGHHRHHHLWILMVSGSLVSGVGFLGIHAGISRYAHLLGVGSIAELPALPAIGLGLFLFNLGAGPVLCGISRALEAQADFFSLKATGNPQAFMDAMRRLSRQNLAEISPPRWAVWLLYDHPPIEERIRMAQGFAGG